MLSRVRGRVGSRPAWRSPGGDVGDTGEAQGADGEVAQGRHDPGRGPGPSPGRVLGEDHVADVVQRLDPLCRLRLWVGNNKRGSSRWWGGRACSAWSPRWN